MTKYYFAGGLRIAGRMVTPSTTASAGDLLAGLPFRGVALPPGVAVGLALVLLLLLLSPGLRGDSRWRVLLVPTRALATAAFFWLALLPPGLAKAALPGDVTLWHYHLDHLGTTHSITDASGNLYRQTRTTAYGEVRGRYDGAGNVVVAEVALRHEFTGYQSEEKSGLQYAGGRYYLPELGVFTSHDPARQFPSPYAYGPGDPVNGTDPTGADFLGIVLLVISIVAAVARFIYTGITTGKWGAAGFGLVVSLAMIAAFYHAGPPIAAGIEELAGETVAAAIGYAQVGYSVYGFADSIRKGDTIGAVTAGLSLAVTAYGLAEDQFGSSTSKVVSGQGKEEKAAPKTPVERATEKLPKNPLPGAKINKKDGPTADGRFSLEGEYRSGKPHHGVDLGADVGTDILAAGDGTVKFTSTLKGYGLTVDINHGDNVVTRYAHLKKALVKAGQVVKAGAKIGTVGRTGNLLAGARSHLHFEVFVGKNTRIDPSDVFSFSQ